MRRWYSSCACYALGASHGARGDKGLVQSLVETGDGLSQVFALLNYHLRLALCQSHRRGDGTGHVGTAERADRVGALRIAQGRLNSYFLFWMADGLKINDYFCKTLKGSKPVNRWMSKN